jgi:hypothetical protein
LLFLTSKGSSVLEVFLWAFLFIQHYFAEIYWYQYV